MNRLPSLTWQQVTRALERAGFVFDRQKGSHMIYYHSVTNRTVVIPKHRCVELRLAGTTNVAWMINLCAGPTMPD